MTGRPRSYGYGGLAKARLIEELITVIVAAGSSDNGGNSIPANVTPPEPLVTTDQWSWRPGDPCGLCGSTDTVWTVDGVLTQAHCNGCGSDDWDDD